MFSQDTSLYNSQIECWKEDFFLHTVGLELSPEDLLRHSLLLTSPLFSLFKDKLFISKLCEKWNLAKVDKFEDFLLLWDSRYLFSEDTSLEYQLERYKLTHTTLRAVRKAAFNGKDSFYNFLLNKYPDNDSVLGSAFRGRLKRRDGSFSVLEVSSDKRDLVIWHALRYDHPFEEIYPGKKREDCIGYNYYDLAVADIAFGREVVYADTVDIVDIAHFLKDASVLDNPKYLNHPHVNPLITPNILIQSMCPQLLSLVDGKDITHCQFFSLSKKTCQLFEEKELWKVCDVFVRDAYAYIWLKDFLARHSYNPTNLAKSDKFLTIRLTLDNGVCGSSISKNYVDPEFYELLEADYAKQEASLS